MSLYVDITKNFGKFKLDVFLEADGITGLLGASGCGKTMTLKCIAGIEKPDRGIMKLGDITLFDSKRRINLAPQKRKVGYLFQNYALFPNMNVRQNILCGMRDESRDVKARKLSEILELMQICGLENHKPHQLSGGQQQRVALARIMIGNPRLLLLDEPFSSLDSHLRGRMQIQMLKLLRNFGKDVLLVTHNRNEAYKLCDSIALIDDGRIITHKDTLQLFSNPGCRYAATMTGCKNIVDAVKSGDYEVEIPEWGVRLSTGQLIHDGLCAIGIRSHSFNPKCTHNNLPVLISGFVEEPFEYTLMFRYESQSDISTDIWWKTSKNKRNHSDTDRLGIAPADILPLYN